MTTSAPSREPFPQILDSTLLATYKSCSHKFWREYVQHYKPRDPSVHLHAGGAFARGLEVARNAYYCGIQEEPVRESLPDNTSRLSWRKTAIAAENAPLAEALGTGALLAAYGSFECPEDSAKSASRMAGALEYYFDSYPLGADGVTPIELPSGKRGIEISFAEPLPIDNPETNEPIIYCGRLDMAADYSGSVFVVDDKTTSSLGATWAKAWDLRSQFTGYTWGLKRAANIEAQGVLVRGVAILKTKYATEQAITYRPDWMVKEWYDMTCETVLDIIRDWKAGKWRKVLDHACVDFGGCGFRRICLSPEPEPWLEQYYQRRSWNPLSREEKVL